MKVEQLLRLKGTIEGSASTEARSGGQGLVAAYPRIRAEVAAAIEDELMKAEFDRLFPTELSTDGQPWGPQAEEVKLYFAQMAGWLDGMIEGSLLERRIRADAEEKAKRVGFGS